MGLGLHEHCVHIARTLSGHCVGVHALHGYCVLGVWVLTKEWKTSKQKVFHPLGHVPSQRRLP
jgi:hypothetical protein